MAQDANLTKNSLIIPGHGTVLVSKGKVADPFDPKNFLIGDDTTYPKNNWMHFGMTSKQNTVEFSKDGGDSSTADTWEFDAVDSTIDPIKWSLTIGALSMHKAMFELAFGGGKHDATLKGYAMGDVEPVEKSLMVLFAHGGKRGGVYIRNAKLSVGDAPSVDVENFFEVQLSATVGQPDKNDWGKIFWFDARDYVKGGVAAG